MNSTDFKLWLIRAETMKCVAHYIDAEFWAGYIRGLRRHYHGEGSGESWQHELFLNIERDEPDHCRRALGEGYRSGFSGVDPIEIARRFRDDYLTTKQLAKKTGLVGSRIRQIVEGIPGGMKTENGWIFPADSKRFVKKQSVIGRPKKTENQSRQ